MNSRSAQTEEFFGSSTQHEEGLESVFSDDQLQNAHDKAGEYLMKFIHRWSQGELFQVYELITKMLDSVRYAYGHEYGVKAAIKMFKDEYDSTEVTLELSEKSKFQLLAFLEGTDHMTLSENKVWFCRTLLAVLKSDLHFAYKELVRRFYFVEEN